MMVMYICFMYLDVINGAGHKNEYYKFLFIHHDDLYAIYMQNRMGICMPNNMMKISKK